MLLSILIPTLVEREEKLKELIHILRCQIIDGNYGREVEILVNRDNRKKTTGQKRNELIQVAKGKYVVFFDDDDEPAHNYISSLVNAAKQDPDAIPINGYMTTNGKNPVKWEMGLNFPYDAVIGRTGSKYYRRFPNHIAAMKKELIKDYKFLHINQGEDYEWAKRIHDDKVLKTEVRVLDLVYHYKFIENK